MVNKCVAHGCKTGYDSEKTSGNGNDENDQDAENNDNDNGNIATFHFPNKEKFPELRAKWVRWVNRKDFSEATDSSVLCEKHFDERFMSRKKRCTLKRKMNPIPTIYSTESLKRPSCLPTPSPPSRKIPKLRGVYEDEINEFNRLDMIHDFETLGEEHAPPGFQTRKDDDCIVYYHLKFDEKTKFPRVFESIRIDTELHVQLQYNGTKVPLPDWFHVGRNAKLNRISMIGNFPSYLRNVAEDKSNDDGSMSILDELEQRKYYHRKGRPPYSAALIRYALLLRYTSAQAYRLLLKQFALPSFSLLNKIKQGGVDSIKALKLLKEKRKISEDVVLMADEMYLQKAAEFAGGEYIGEDENGDLYKGIVAFMVVGVKSSTPYVIKATPEVTIKGKWLADEIDGCVSLLAENGFRVRAVVTDNHSTNVNAFKVLKKKHKSESEYFIEHPKNHGKKTYLFYDNVHLLKNIRNNLLSNKKFVFPAFDFTFGDKTISSPDGYIAWSDLHRLHEKDAALDANLRKAPKLNYSVLHPGNNKQDVGRALAVFHDTTIAGFKSHLPDATDCAGFLSLINTWWLVVNSKKEFHVNSIGDAIKAGDGKVQFLRDFADWLEEWNTSPNFTLTPQTSYALVTTLRAQVLLVEELLDDGYDYVMMARFQSDPLERRFSQYRQMSGGRFLVSLREVNNSERILQCRSLLKEDIDFWEEDIGKEKVTMISDTFSQYLVEHSNDISEATISNDSIEVATDIAGYIAKKLKERSKCDACQSAVVSKSIDDVENNNYLKIRSRGGLIAPSQELADFACNGFAALDYTSAAIRADAGQARYLGQHVLSKFFHHEKFTCSVHEKWGLKFASKIIVNCFFNNKKKRTNADIRKDAVTTFKKRQRLK